MRGECHQSFRRPSGRVLRFRPRGRQGGQGARRSRGLPQNGSPRVVGLIVEVPGKRRVFVSIGRVTSIGSGQIITTGLINVRRFEQRGGEVRVIAEMLGRKVGFVDGSGAATIEDVAIERGPDPGEWAVSELFVRRPKAALRRSPRARRCSPPGGTSARSDGGEAQSAEQLLATYEDLLPADLANTLLDLPSSGCSKWRRSCPTSASPMCSRRCRKANRSTSSTTRRRPRGRRARPDAAGRRGRPHRAAPGRTRRDAARAHAAGRSRRRADAAAYAPDTAGGLMTTEPIIVSADATVAEGSHSSAATNSLPRSAPPCA